MKKFFLLTACLIACLALNAQDTKVTISRAVASSYQTDHEASKAVDGNTETIWHSNWSTIPDFPVVLTLKLSKAEHVDYVRYIPRQDGSINGHWKEVTVSYCSTTNGSTFTKVGDYNLNGEGSSFDFDLSKVETCGQIKFTISPGANDNGKNLASAAELEAYTYNTEKSEAFAPYFEDDLYTTLKAGVTSSEGIADADVKALVASILENADAYKKFRVGEYEPYMTTSTLKNTLKTSAQYNNYENPTGIYLKSGESCYVVVSGIGSSPVGLKIKDWYKSGDVSSYPLHNGLNHITATTEGNVFVNYYTDDFDNADNVKVHFINAPVLGYWDQATMKNADWENMLKGTLAADDVILIARSEHAQVAYPVGQWKKHCPSNIESTMAYYQKVQWAQRDILGLERYKKTVKNRQLFYADKSRSMYAGGDAGVCGYEDLGAIMNPDAKGFDFWGVGHEWGHNNQIQGFHWSGCGETTNNIYASWGQFHAQMEYNDGKTFYLRLEDEVTGVNEYSGMRGGRMQVYFEEGLRKGIAWQLQDGPDYHKATPATTLVDECDADGKKTGNKVPSNSRNYDHFVKYAPFWQLNLWGTLAGKCPDIIPMVIESIRTTENYTSTYNTNGKQQINWMKLACDSAKINLLPFFEKAGMLRPIKAYIEDYGKGWNIITEEMINDLKAYVAEKGYPDSTEEINYINGYNYLTYKEQKALVVPTTLGEGCKISGKFMKVDHTKVQNAVAFETFNVKGELMHITMFGLGSDDAHSYTQVIFPSEAAYIMAVGYDGTRKMIYHNAPIELTTDVTKPIYYTIYNTRSKEPGGLIYYAGDEIGLKDGCTSLEIEDKYQFYFTGTHDAMYIHNKATTKKLASVESWTAEGVEWAIGVSPKGNGWAIGPKGGLEGGNCINEKNTEAKENESDFTVWSANDDGSIFVLEKVETQTLPEPGKFYVIECPLFYDKQGVHKGLYVNSEGKPAWNTIEVTDKNYYWKIVDNNGVVSLQNVGTGKYLNGTEMSTAAVGTTINYLGSAYFNIKVNDVTVHANGHNGGSAAEGNIVSYPGAVGSASAWSFVEKQDPDQGQKVTLTYVFKHNGSQVATQVFETFVGEEYPNIIVPYYGVVVQTEKPEGTISKAGVVNVDVNVTYDLPFVPAATYASITNWYYVKFDSNNSYYLYHSEGKNHISLDQKSVAADKKDAYTWAFVGNPFDGFKVVNKATGESKVLSSSTTMSGDTGADTWPIMTATPVPDGNNELWVLSESTHAEGGFFMAQKGHANQRLNNRGSKLAYWTGGAGVGSTFIVEERDLSGATELQALVDLVKEKAGQWTVGTAVGYVTEESKNAVQTALEAAESAITNEKGCNEAQVALQNAIDAVAIVLPTAGKYYRMTNHTVANSVMYVAGDKGLSHKSGAIADGSDIFQFVPAEGGFYLFNVARGTYLSTAMGYGQGRNYSEATDVKDAKVLTVASFNDGSVPQVSLIPAGGTTMHADTNYGTVVGWDGGSNSKSAWYVSEVAEADVKHTLTVTEAGWASLVLGFNATMPTDVKAYIVSGVDNSKATLVEVDVDVLPANTPVLVEAAAGSYDFVYTIAAADAVEDNNLLQGKPYNTYLATVEGTTNYVLSYQGEGTKVLGFYKKTVLNADLSDEDDVKDDEGKVTEAKPDHITFDANKAYLPVTKTDGAPAPMLRISRGETGIEALGAQSAIEAIYDITGRRVEKMEKGIYIVNGRKVVIK